MIGSRLLRHGVSRTLLIDDQDVIPVLLSGFLHQPVDLAQLLGEDESRHRPVA
jgi:hypothetical protein